MGNSLEEVIDKLYNPKDRTSLFPFQNVRKQQYPSLAEVTSHNADGLIIIWTVQSGGKGRPERREGASENAEYHLQIAICARGAIYICYEARYFDSTAIMYRIP